MTKEVREVLHKFYMSLEDAQDDYNHSFCMVEVEGMVQPNEARAPIDVINLKILDETNDYSDDIVAATGIFKIKTMLRETLFGQVMEKVYIYNHYEDLGED